MSELPRLRAPACASRPRPRVTRTSARRTCRCSTSRSRASRAASSSCASRTPTARASAPTASSRSSTPCAGSGCTWDEGPDVGGPYAPYRQSERLDTYRPYVERLLAEGHAYHCWCSTERLAQMRDEQQKPKQPTGYDRLCHGKTARGAVPAARLQRDARGAHARPRRRAAALRRPDPRPGLGADDRTTRSSSRPTASRPTTSPSSSTTTRWASPTSCAARSGSARTPKHVLLYRWLGPGGAGLRAHAAAAQHRQVEDQQAQEPGGTADLVPRAGLPARGAGELPRAAGLPAEAGRRGQRRGGLHLRGVRRRTSTGAKVNPVGPDLRPQEARVAQRRLHPRPRGRRPRQPAAALPPA